MPRTIPALRVRESHRLGFKPVARPPAGRIGQPVSHDITSARRKSLPDIASSPVSARPTAVSASVDRSGPATGMSAIRSSSSIRDAYGLSIR
jgi:hypothetical protein